MAQTKLNSVSASQNVALLLVFGQDMLKTHEFDLCDFFLKVKVPV